MRILRLLMGVVVLGGCVAEVAEPELSGTESEIRNGALAAPGQFMSTVTLYDSTDGCTGTLISRNVVLTAAHCFCNPQTGQCSPNVSLIAFRDDPNQPDTQLVTTSGSIYRYPGYVPDSAVNDIAVVVIHGVIPAWPFTSSVASTRLSTGTKVMMVGLGYTGSTCQYSLPAWYPPIPYAGVTAIDSYVYNNGSFRTNKAQSCEGDSGGGVFKDNGTFYPSSVVYGVESSGSSTHDTVTATANYYSWIMSYVNSTPRIRFKLAPADYDNDGMVDIGVKFDNGNWRISLAKNGFRGWDCLEEPCTDKGFSGYGDSGSTPVPGDYDGDAKTDLAVKTQSGQWMINYASDGLRDTFDFTTPAIFGDSTNIPVPADYDGDGRVDPAVKNSLGQWKIAYSSSSLSVVYTYTGYGDASAVPVPGFYDSDNKADLAIKNSLGQWGIDYAWNGFVGWGYLGSAYGDATAIPVPGLYDGDELYDISVKGASGEWFFDFAADLFGSWAWGWTRSGYGSTGTPLWANPAQKLPAHGIFPRTTPGDFDGDHITDWAVLGTDGILRIDLSRSPSDGFNVVYPMIY